MSTGIHTGTTGHITAQPEVLRTAADRIAECADAVHQIRTRAVSHPPGQAVDASALPALHRAIELLSQNHDRVAEQLGRLNESLVSISAGTRTLADAIAHSDSVATVRMESQSAGIAGGKH